VTPIVSIIIPCHNYERWLVECMKSLERDFAMCEISIGHDDCSDQIEWKWCDLPNISITHYGENFGVSCVRNFGLDLAKGKYVWFLDSDDMAIPGGLKARVDFLESHPKYSMVWGNALKINVDRGSHDWGFDKCMENLGSLERYSRRLNAQTLLWRREVFAKYGGYYEKLRSKEDKELLYRLGLHPDSPLPTAIRATHIDVDCAIYRRHPDAKHKRRLADKKWSAETDKIFNARIKQLKKEGVTKDNTRFPTWA